MQYKPKIKRRDRERGQSLVEYALILILVAIPIVVIITVFGEALETSYHCILASVEGVQGSGFTLIDSGTDEDIKEIVCGETLRLADLPPTINIRLNVEDTYGSAVMTLTGATSQSRTENAVPYALWGNSGTDYYDGTLNAGNHKLVVTFYSGGSASGNELGERIFYFNVE